MPWYISSGIPSKEKFEVLDANAVELARQLTLLEAALFNRVTRDEFLHGAWYAKDALKEQRAPHLLRLIAHGNLVTRWVITEILKHPSHAARAAILAHVISVASALEGMHNYNGVIQMLSALHSATICKLKQAWELVPKDKRAAFERVTTLMSNTGHYKAYHDELHALAPDTPCIPLICARPPRPSLPLPLPAHALLLAVICQDLFTVNDSNADYAQASERKDWINWEKMTLIARCAPLSPYGPARSEPPPLSLSQSHRRAQALSPRALQLRPRARRARSLPRAPRARPLTRPRTRTD